MLFGLAPILFPTLVNEAGNLSYGPSSDPSLKIVACKSLVRKIPWEGATLQSYNQLQWVEWATGT